ncbi:hypothetical protein GP486_003513, partial [Trichoglossum hirsutum]
EAIQTPDPANLNLIWTTTERFRLSLCRLRAPLRLERLLQDPSCPCLLFEPPPKLGEGPSYDPTPDGVVPPFVAISMPASLTRFEIGAIKSKYAPKYGSKAYWVISPKGNTIQAITSDGDGNEIPDYTIDAYFDLRKKSTFISKLKTKWLEWYKAVQDINQENRATRECMAQKVELEAEVEYAAANHPGISRSEIGEHAITIQKLREEYPSKVDIPELSDFILLVQGYVQLGPDPGFTPDFFVLHQNDYWAAKGRSDSDEAVRL